MSLLLLLVEEAVSETQRPTRLDRWSEPTAHARPMREEENEVEQKEEGEGRKTKTMTTTTSAPWQRRQPLLDHLHLHQRLDLCHFRPQMNDDRCPSAK